MYRNRFLVIAAAAAVLSVGAAQAADLPVERVAARQAFYPVPLFTWQGAYVGASVGYSFSGDNRNTHENNNNFGGTGGTYNSSNMRGMTYGAHAGYNWQFGQIVVGAELGINGTSIEGDVNYPQYNNTTGTEIDYYGTAKLRVGYAFDRVLVYVNGGYAGGEIGINQIYAPPVVANGSRFSASDFRSGFTLGAGVEYAITNNVIARLEYEYLDFGRKSYEGRDSSNVLTRISNKTTANVVKVGLSYKF